MTQVESKPNPTSQAGPAVGPTLMRAARYHGQGKFSVDLIDRPTPRPTEVIVEVKACGMVPNLVAMIDPSPHVVAPPRPTIYGLDAVGVVVQTGSQVRGHHIGDRVYVNPHRYCGNCRHCRRGNPAACAYSSLNGYFGIGPKSLKMLEDYPYGGFAEYMNVPEYALVKLPDNVTWEAGTRWGYLGTAYAALRRADVGFHTTVLINGISGTLGIGAALFALGLGATKVLGIGRDQRRLDDVKALAPDRIEVLSVAGGASVGEWARAHTDGYGADVVIDALPTAGSQEAFVAAIQGLAQGGIHVNPGGVHGPVPIDVTAIMLSQQSFLGSFWMTSKQGEEMAELVRKGKVNLDVFEHVSFDLGDIEEAIRVISGGNQHGGFTNYLITT